MKISDLIKKVKSRASRKNYKDNLDPEFTREIGGKYWKMMSGTNQLQYLNLTSNMIEDHIDADPHIGDDNFQAKVIGKAPIFVAESTPLLHDNYVEAKKKDEDKFFNFRKSLLGDIEVRIGSFEYANLIKAVALYQDNPGNKDSRIMRVLDSDREVKSENDV